MLILWRLVTEQSTVFSKLTYKYESSLQSLSSSSHNQKNMKAYSDWLYFCFNPFYLVSYKKIFDIDLRIQKFFSVQLVLYDKLLSRTLFILFFIITMQHNLCIIKTVNSTTFPCILQHFLVWLYIGPFLQHTVLYTTLQYIPL